MAASETMPAVDAASPAKPTPLLDALEAQLVEIRDNAVRQVALCDSQLMLIRSTRLAGVIARATREIETPEPPATFGATRRQHSVEGSNHGR